MSKGNIFRDASDQLLAIDFKRSSPVIKLIETSRESVFLSPGLEPSLNEGLGFIPVFKKPLAGTRPSGDDLIHIVPPVMIIKTLDSGNCAAILIDSFLVGLLVGDGPLTFQKRHTEEINQLDIFLGAG